MKIKLSSDEILNISQLFNEVCNGFNIDDIVIHNENDLIKTNKLFDEIYSIVNTKEYKDYYEYTFDKLIIIYKTILENYIYYIVLEKDVLNSRCGVEEEELLELMKKFELLLKKARFISEREELVKTDASGFEERIKYLENEIKELS
jgi:hypothetical protein